MRKCMPMAKQLGVPAARIFSRVWDAFIMALRRNDLISNDEQGRLMYGDALLGQEPQVSAGSHRDAPSAGCRGHPAFVHHRVSSWCACMQLPLLFYAGKVSKVIARANEVLAVARAAADDDALLAALKLDDMTKDSLVEIAGTVPRVLITVCRSHSSIGYHDHHIVSTIQRLCCQLPTASTAAPAADAAATAAGAQNGGAGTSDTASRAQANDDGSQSVTLGMGTMTLSIPGLDAPAATDDADADGTSAAGASPHDAADAPQDASTPPVGSPSDVGAAKAVPIEGSADVAAAAATDAPPATPPPPSTRLKETVVLLLGGYAASNTPVGRGEHGDARGVASHLARLIARLMVEFERTGASTRLQGSPLTAVTVELLAFVAQLWSGKPDAAEAGSAVPVSSLLGAEAAAIVELAASALPDSRAGPQHKQAGDAASATDMPAGAAGISHGHRSGGSFAAPLLQFVPSPGGGTYASAPLNSASARPRVRFATEDSLAGTVAATSAANKSQADGADSHGTSAPAASASSTPTKPAAGTPSASTGSTPASGGRRTPSSAKASAPAATPKQEKTAKRGRLPAARFGGIALAHPQSTSPTAGGISADTRSIAGLVALLRTPNEYVYRIDGTHLSLEVTSAEYESLCEAARRAYYHITLTHKDASLSVPEADRRVRFFIQSLYMHQMPDSSSVLEMPAFNAVTVSALQCMVQRGAVVSLALHLVSRPALPFPALQPIYGESILFDREGYLTKPDPLNYVTPMLYLKTQYR